MSSTFFAEEYRTGHAIKGTTVIAPAKPTAPTIALSGVRRTSVADTGMMALVAVETGLEISCCGVKFSFNPFPNVTSQYEYLWIMTIIQSFEYCPGPLLLIARGFPCGVTVHQPLFDMTSCNFINSISSKGSWE